MSNSNNEPGPAMSITISTKNGVFTTFTFRGGEFETVSPGEWLDSDGLEVGSAYSEALADLAQAVAQDPYASQADRDCGAQASFIRVYR